MANFSTTFNVENSVSANSFLDVVSKWLNGMRAFRFREFLAHLREEEKIDLSENDTAISFRNIFIDGDRYIGLKYRYSEDNLIWDTEVVFTAIRGENRFSIRVTNLSGTANPNLPEPRRPFIVKQLLKEGWGGYDGLMKVRDRAHKISIDDVEVVSNLIIGNTRHELPIIYVSIDGDGRYKFDCDNLAWRLGGVSHVFCEPSRSFSFKLAKRVNYKNPYLGAVGIYFPDGSTTIFRPDEVNEAAVREMQLSVIRATSNMMGSEVCSWANIKEVEASMALKQLRDDKSEDVSAYIHAFDEQVASLKTKNEALEAENTALKLRKLMELNTKKDAHHEVFGLSVDGGELYQNEIKHIISKGLAVLAKNSDPNTRKYELAKTLEDQLNRALPAFDLEKRIKACFSKYDGMTPSKKSEIESLGFSVSEDGKHYKLVFMDDSRYTFALSKTPGDHRSGKNMASDICNKIL